MKKENELKGLRKRSEEMEDVMGQTPSWVFRWGIITMAVIVACLLASTWFLQWPDTLTAHGYIEVTRSSCPWTDMVIQLSAQQICSLREGMEAQISLNARDKEWGLYQGVLMPIPLMTDSTGLYTVHIRMNKYERTTEGHASIAALEREPSRFQHPRLETTAIIILSDKRLLLRIMGR